MSATPGDARLEQEASHLIAPLATLYDRFAHALDPYSPAADAAEKQFNEEVAFWYDSLKVNPKPSPRDFRRFVIAKCKEHLSAQDRKITVIQPEPPPTG